jgi:hypothetical protein
MDPLHILIKASEVIFALTKACDEGEIYLHFLLTSALDRSEWSAIHPGCFYLGE